MRNKRSIQNTVLQSLLALPLLFAFSCSKNLTDQLPEFFLFDAINPPLYSVSGAVSGLAMNGLILSNNGDTVTLDAPASDFVFPRRLRTDTVYNVAISKHPGDVTQSQLCTVVGGNGSIGNGDVGGVQVNCANAATIKVSVPAGGLQGTGLILLNNGGDPLTINGPIASATDFAFKTPLIATSNNYDVTVGTQPINPHQTCSVTGGTDTYLGGYPDFVPGISVDCVTNRYSISVNVTGLVSGNTLVLSNAFPTYPAETGLESYPATSAGSETLSVTTNGVSSPFATKIRSGETYAIAIDTQPSGQTCVIGAPTGNVTSANIVVPVNCTKNSYFIQGTVTGLAGSNLRIAVTGGNSQTINVSGAAFTSTAIPYGTTYTLRILNPTNLWQTCSFIDEGDTGGAIDSSGAVDAMGMVWNDRISGGSMNLAGNITGIEIECVTNSFTIGGKIIGYPAGSYTQDIVLQLNGDPASNMTIPAPASGSSVNFVFPALYAVNSGSAYNVSVITNPQKLTGSTLKCAVSGNGTVAGANVTGVTVSCTPAPAINVTVTGFGVSPASNFTLDPDGAGAYPATTVNANGVYSFFVANGQSYYFNTPTPPNQSCSWTTASSGTMGTTNVALALDCTPMITSTSVNADAGTLEFDKGTGPFTITFNKNINLPVSSNSSTSCASQAIQISMVNAGGASVIPVNNNFTSCVPVSLSVSGNVLTVTPNAAYMWYEATYKIRIRNSSVTDTGGKSMAYATSGSCTPVGCYESATGFNTGGLVRLYETVSGSYNTDRSRSGMNLSGGTSTTTGVDGDGSGAMSFGVNGTLNSPSTGLPLGASERTMCGWIQPYTLAAPQIVLSYGSFADGFGINILDTGVNAGVPSNPYVASGQRLPLYTWSHLCLRANSTTITLFLNGKSIGTVAAGALNTANGNLYAGTNTSWALGPAQGVAMDGVRIYNASLPDRQIRYLATQVPTGLIARYALDSADGTDDEWWDSSGWDQPLTASGGGAVPATDRFGIAASAYGFMRASSQFLSAPNSAVHNPGGTMTVMAWVKPATLPGSGEIYTVVSNRSGDDGFAFELYNTAGSQTLYLWGDGGDGATSAAFSLPVGVYTHVAATFSGGTTRFYVDGNEISSTVALNVIIPGNGLLYIGRRDDGHYMNGEIDEVRLYNRALSLAEIQAMVQQPNKKIFVTVNAYTGNLGGIAGADAICNADTTRPDYSKLYKALLADNSNRFPCLFGTVCANPTRLSSRDWSLQPFVTYVRPDNQPIMKTNAAGIYPFGVLSNPIGAGTQTTWTGLFIGSGYWEQLDSLDERCQNWTDGSAVQSSAWGATNATDATSMSQNYSNNSSCDQPKHLYCVEQ
jgi:hypothetical protein